MHDGPGPMRDSKPAKKVDNAVDLFSKAHQVEYEARSRPSRDLVQEAQQHNCVHPTLRDELQKRRSIARVTVVKHVQTCRACAKLKQKVNAKRKYNRTIRKKTSNSYYRSKRINKKTDRKKISTNKRKTPHVSTECQCYYVPNNHSRTGALCTSACSNKQTLNVFKNPTQNISKMGDHLEKTKSNASSGYPASSKPSRTISSYHSYLSMDHEPMV